jgi:hypothetical protein
MSGQTKSGVLLKRDAWSIKNMDIRQRGFLLTIFAILSSIIAPMTGAADFAPDQGQAQAGPQAVFSERLYDAGTVEPGVDLAHTFNVKNVGKADLVIEQVNPG